MTSLQIQDDGGFWFSGQQGCKFGTTRMQIQDDHLASNRVKFGNVWVKRGATIFFFFKIQSNKFLESIKIISCFHFLKNML